MSIQITVHTCTHFTIAGTGVLGDGSTPGKIVLNTQSDTLHIKSATGTTFNITTVAAKCGHCGGEERNGKVPKVKSIWSDSEDKGTQTNWKGV